MASEGMLVILVTAVDASAHKQQGQQAEPKPTPQTNNPQSSAQKETQLKTLLSQFKKQDERNTSCGCNTHTLRVVGGIGGRHLRNEKLQWGGKYTKPQQERTHANHFQQHQSRPGSNQCNTFLFG